MKRRGEAETQQPRRRRHAIEPLLAAGQRPRLGVADLAAELADVFGLGAPHHAGHGQPLVGAVAVEAPVHGERDVDVGEDHQLAAPVAHGVDATVFAGRLGDALHRPGREREVVALSIVAAEGFASRGDVDLGKHRNVVPRRGHAQCVGGGRACVGERQLLVCARRVVHAAIVLQARPSRRRRTIARR